MSRTHFILATGFFAAGLVAGVGTTASAADAGRQLLSHRAVYDLALGKTDGSHSAPISARGRIVYEFTGSPCEGWVTNFRQITEVQQEEGDPRVSDMRTSTFEEGDGSAFRFKTDTYVNNKLVDSVDGKATHGADGALAVDISQPTPSKTDISPGGLFPTMQILHIMDAARAGQKTAEIRIFDGSDSGRKVFDTMTVIGRSKPSDTGEAIAAQADALKGVQRWPVSVSYFDPATHDGAPNYILGFDLYENGVSSALRIDYGSYVLDGKMTKFEALPQKACEK